MAKKNEPAKAKEGAEKKDAKKKEDAEKKEDVPKVEAAPPVEVSNTGLAAQALPSKCQCEFNDFCTCDGVLKYLDCISKKCASDECDCHQEQFEVSCANVGNMCGAELEFGCSTEQATCRGRFHQLPDSVVGITVDTESLNQKSYCGPFGKCEGSVEAKVKVSHVPEEGATVQCEMQRFEGAKEVDAKGWNKCQAEVDKNGEAVCSLPMPKNLKPGASLEGKCVAAAQGKKLLKRHRLVEQTKYAWWQISNKYQPPAASGAEKKESDKGKKKAADEKSGAPARSGVAAAALPLGLVIWGVISA